MNFINILKSNHHILIKNRLGNNFSILKKIIFKNPRVYVLEKNISHKCRIFMNFNEKTMRDGLRMRSHFERTLWLKYITLFISLIGIAETSYLSFSKFNDSKVLCVSQSCSFVLNSVFSELISFPIVYIGFVLYTMTFLSSFLKFSTNEYSKKSYFLDMISIFFSFFLGNFSLLFAFILEILLYKNCPWCMISIALSGIIFFFQNLILSGRFALNLKSFIYIVSFCNSFAIIFLYLNVIEISFLTK
jgi:uncharacterized membrane protein